MLRKIVNCTVLQSKTVLNQADLGLLTLRDSRFQRAQTNTQLTNPKVLP